MTGEKLASLEEARAAKAKAIKLLHDQPLVGIGITRLGDGYALKVNLSRSVGAEALPSHVDGVPVVAEVVGEISKR